MVILRRKTNNIICIEGFYMKFILYEKLEHRWIKCIELKGDIEK